MTEKAVLRVVDLLLLLPSISAFNARVTSSYVCHYVTLRWSCLWPLDAYLLVTGVTWWLPWSSFMTKMFCCALLYILLSLKLF